MPPALRTLVIADDPAGWEQAGFTVSDDAKVWIGGIGLHLVGRPEDRPERGGIVAWHFDGVDDGVIDGITTIAAGDPPAEPEQPEHANGACHLDHIVMLSPDLDRTVQALRMYGFEPRRTRVVPGTEPERRQVFFWAGPTIIELVGPTVAVDTGPARLWGLAISTDDLDRAAERLGPRLGSIGDAVQQGRRIATIRTDDLGIGPAIALMTPHDPDA